MSSVCDDGGAAVEEREGDVMKSFDDEVRSLERWGLALVVTVGLWAFCGVVIGVIRLAATLGWIELSGVTR